MHTASSSKGINSDSLSFHPPAPKPSVLDDILVYPSASGSSRTTSKATLLKHLFGDQFIQYLQKKKKENKKVRRKEEREQKKKEREQKKKKTARGTEKEANGERT